VKNEDPYPCKGGYDNVKAEQKQPEGEYEFEGRTTNGVELESEANGVRMESHPSCATYPKFI